MIWIALFRGINVGGNNILPMKELVAVLEELGLANVRTYIQSGNAVFQSTRKSVARLRQSISGAVAERFGFRPEVLLLRSDQLGEMIDANPFAASHPSRLHMLVMQAAPANPDLEAIEALRAATEDFRLVDAVAYLHAPDGIGRSKLAAKLERLLGEPGTGRNLRTMARLREMAEAAT